MLRRRPESIEGFVRETLRLAGPIRRLNRRVIAAAMALDRVTIPANSGVILDIERAHRDPAPYPLPEAIDLDRRGPPLLAFSDGAHY